MLIVFAQLSPDNIQAQEITYDILTLNLCFQSPWTVGQ